VTLTPLLQELINSLRCLPGVGYRSAQRMAFHLIERDRKGARSLSRALGNALEKVDYCTRCRNLSETPLCLYCTRPNRDESLLCIVECPADLLAIEQTTVFKGRYFVLMGRLSPLDGLGPEELGIELLITLLNQGDIKEVVIATNTTVEGEATAHYLSQLVKTRHIKASRIAHGIPLGGELEFIDSTTLGQALTARTEII